MRIATDPADRRFHGYAGDAPIFVSAGRDVLVDRFADDEDRVLVGVGRHDSIVAKLTSREAVRLGAALLDQLAHRPAGVNPVELSVLIGQHTPVEVDPCRVCGHELTITSMGGGEATKYVCGSPAASVLGKDGGLWGAAAEEAYAHRRRSEVLVAYHGDSTVVAVLHELRRLRALLGEDMTAPVGAVHFPNGHGKNQCYRFLRHLGGDRWEQVVDFDFEHDPTHKTLKREETPMTVHEIRPQQSLRELLAGPVEEPHPTTDADHFARFRLGNKVANRIQWSVNEDHEVTGVLGDGTDTLYLAYEISEPGAEMISVRVVCPIDGRCEDAWGVVESPADLLAVLNGVPHEDPQCLTHEAEIEGLDFEDDDDPDAGVGGSDPVDQPGWPPYSAT